MKRTSMKKTLSLILCIVLITAMALVTTGCSGKPDDMAVSDVITFSDGDTIGEGKNTFPLTIVHKDGTELTVTVNTELTAGAGTDQRRRGTLRTLHQDRKR